MTNRDKLIELLCLGTHKTETCNSHEDCSPTIGDCGFCTIMADHLLANGVTVQQWISAEKPPEDWKGEGGYLTNYYVYTPEYGVDIGSYLKPANKWLCMGIPCNVTHWMPLPEPPQ